MTDYNAPARRFRATAAFHIKCAQQYEEAAAKVPARIRARVEANAESAWKAAELAMNSAVSAELRPWAFR